MTTAQAGLALATQDLEVRYGEGLALHGINLEVPHRSVLTLLGVNGAGKSTFARACSGLVPSTTGRIVLDGTDVTGWPAQRIRRAGLIYLPEGRGILPNMTVLENLRIAAKLLPTRRERQEAIDRAYSLFPILGDRRNQRSGSMSGGEQQMLSLARAFVVDAKIVIVDEPSLGLAPMLVEMVFESLVKAKELGTTMVIIEQFAQRALGMSDRCAILRRGEIAWSGLAGQASEHVVLQYFGAERDDSLSNHKR